MQSFLDKNIVLFVPHHEEPKFCCMQTRTQYKWTGHCQKYKDMLSWLFLALFQSTTGYKIDSE